MSENTLRQVKQTDHTWFKECVNTFIGWYFRNCQEITDLAEYFGEDDADTLTSVLSSGLREIQDRRDILMEADAKRGDQL